MSECFLSAPFWLWWHNLQDLAGVHRASFSGSIPLWQQGINEPQCITAHQCPHSCTVCEQWLYPCGQEDHQSKERSIVSLFCLFWFSSHKLEDRMGNIRRPCRFLDLTLLPHLVYLSSHIPWTPALKMQRSFSLLQVFLCFLTQIVQASLIPSNLGS